MESKRNRGKFWTKILILLFVIATGYLVMIYQQQSAKRDDLQQQISDLTNSNAALAMSSTQGQSELSAEQLILRQDKLESDIKFAKDNLKQSVITNDHIVTLVQVAREAGVKLVSVQASEQKTSTFETIPFDIMPLKIVAEGNRSNVIDFVSQICEAFQTAIIRDIGIQIREEDTSEILLFSLDMGVYSYRD